jgi:hypothetical protein
MIRKNKELEEIWKEAFLVSFHVLSTHFLGMTEKATKSLDLSCPGRNTKQVKQSHYRPRQALRGPGG